MVYESMIDQYQITSHKVVFYLGDHLNYRSVFLADIIMSSLYLYNKYTTESNLYQNQSIVSQQSRFQAALIFV